MSPAQTFSWMTLSRDMIANISFAIRPKREKLMKVLGTLSQDVKHIDPAFVEFFAQSSQEAGIDNCILEMKPFSDDEFRSLKMPVLVMIGDNDLFNSDRSLEQAAEMIPNVRTRKVKHCGHFMNLDQPEEVDQEVIRFLAKSAN